MSENEQLGKEDILIKPDVEFSNEFNIGLDYNANLHPLGKEEINKVKEFYDSRL